MSNSSFNRRQFLARTGKAAAVPLLASVSNTVLGANDRISIGIIGCGSRGRNAHMEQIHRFSEEQNVVITAVCDVWRQHREQAADMVKEWYDLTPFQCENYQEILARDDIDAVSIASPDHHHCAHLTAAANAKKDAYCEKPLAMNMRELNKAVDAVKRNETVVQIGTQLRSWPSFTGCKKVVQEGKLGQIIKCMQVRNSYRPYWHQYAKPVEEKDANWKTFLGNAQPRPFDPDRFSAWYGYRDYSTGAIGGFMSHFIDLVHYITGAKFPLTAVTMGGIYRWKDQRTCPDSVHTLLDYGDFMVSYCTVFGNNAGNTMRFLGTKGDLDTTDWRNPVMSGESVEDPDRIKGTSPVPEVSRPQHMEDWLQCLRTRNKPNADIDAGYQHAVAVLLSDMAMTHQRMMKFDPAARRIRRV